MLSNTRLCIRSTVAESRPNLIMMGDFEKFISARFAIRWGTVTVSGINDNRPNIIEWGRIFNIYVQKWALLKLLLIYSTKTIWCAIETNQLETRSTRYDQQIDITEVEVDFREKNRPRRHQIKSRDSRLKLQYLNWQFRFMHVLMRNTNRCPCSFTLFGKNMTESYTSFSISFLSLMKLRIYREYLRLLG
jgi:hypothetical protein